MFLELLKVEEKFTKDMTYSIIPNKCSNASLWLASPYNKGIDLWIFVRVVGMTCPIRPFISSCNFQWSLTKTYNSLHIPTYHPMHIPTYVPIHIPIHDYTHLCTAAFSYSYIQPYIRSYIHPLHSPSQDPTLHIACTYTLYTKTELTFLICSICDIPCFILFY